MSKAIENIDTVEDVVLENNEPVEAIEEPVIEAPKSETKWKTKECPVVKYVASNGVLGFTFDNVPCQITIDKNLEIGSTVKIKYQGSIGKGIKFKF